MFLFELFPPIINAGLGTLMLYKLLKYIITKNNCNIYSPINLHASNDSSKYFEKLGFKHIGNTGLLCYTIEMQMNIKELFNKLKEIIDNRSNINLCFNDEKLRCSKFIDETECKNNKCYYNNVLTKCVPLYLSAANNILK